MFSLKFCIHYGLHFLFPGVVAYVYNPKKWKQNWLILLSTMLIDLDHLLATPIFDPNRCRIGFHPLHSFYAFIVYLILLHPKKTNLIGIGYLRHLCTDYVDSWRK